MRFTTFRVRFTTFAGVYYIYSEFTTLSNKQWAQHIVSWDIFSTIAGGKFNFAQWASRLPFRPRWPSPKSPLLNSPNNGENSLHVIITVSIILCYFSSLSYDYRNVIWLINFQNVWLTWAGWRRRRKKSYSFVIVAMKRKGKESIRHSMPDNEPT